MTKMNVVVTGGGTIAPVDDVRLITNVSSGRLAAAITESFLDRGASVWHIHAPAAQVPLMRMARFALDAADPSADLDRLTRLRRRWLDVRDRLHLVPLEVGTVADYASTLKATLEGRPIDVAVLPMAVSDFEPEPYPGKLSSESETLVVPCRRTPKVIRSVRDWAPSVYLVGFKLLSNVPREELIRRAGEACRTNRADLTVANDLQTLRQGKHTLHLVRPGAEPETLDPGDDLADRLVERIMTWADRARRDRPPATDYPSS
jgi:phosphopantothenate---cysteine ligase (CTP)